MIETLSILIFIFYLYGFGKLSLAGKSQAITEIFSTGLSSIIVFGITINLLRIPVDWRIFLVAALIIPMHDLIKWRRGGIKFLRIHRPSWQAMIVLLVFIFALIIYCWGPFQYPWFEDDDPWSHAASIKYVAVEKNLNVPSGVFQYLNPYPPGYTIILGVLHQINPSIYWTMKFFNGLFICLGFLFFYMFTEELRGDKNKAVLATFFLAMIPCYLTHFIWSHALVITLFYSAFYFLLKSLKEKKYIWPAIICCAAVALTQPTQAIKFTIMSVLLIISFIPRGIRWKNLGIVVTGASILSLLWWGPVILNAIQGRSEIAIRAGAKVAGHVGDTIEISKSLFSPSGGTATRAYMWEDYCFIRDPNLINNPTGLGLMFCLLLFLGLILGVLNFIKERDPRERSYLLTIFLWLFFTFIGMNTMTFNLPIGLFAFRFWMLFAIPVSILSAEAVISFNKYLNFKWNKILVVILFILAILRVNLPVKWKFNTMKWSYGIHWASDDDINGYVWLRKNLKTNTRVFSFTDNILVLGHDMHTDFWSENYKQAFKDAFNQPLDHLYRNLIKSNYRVLIISPRDIWEYGREAVNNKLRLLNGDSRFTLIFNNPAVKIFHVRESQNIDEVDCGAEINEESDGVCRPPE
ncbi:MAG: hypothetical protein AB1650_06620 [Candidatus Omnitrophota bacterium]